MKALIVGGGIGGLTAACALSRVGIDATVFEAATEFRPLGGGLGIGSNALVAAQKIGIADAIIEAGQVCTAFEVRTEHGELIFTAPFYSVGQALGAPTIGILRSDLQLALLNQLAPEAVRFGHACARVEQDATSVRVTFTNGEVATGDLLVGADGFDSVVRNYALGASSARIARYVAWVGVSPSSAAKLLPGHTVHYWGRGKRFGIVDVGGDRTYWWGTRNGGEPSDDVSAVAKDEVLQCFAGWSEPIQRVIEATFDPGVIAFWTRDRKPTRGWTKGRVTLLGDAAHPMLTSLAQGASSAIEDAVELARCLTQMSSRSPVAALREYESRRVPHTTRLVNRTRQVSYYEQLESRWACGLRNQFFRLLPERAIRRQTEWLLQHRE
jgi:2-polyprenyl-6-methoxyphenol hydroxylase-like FAD-dependent oxidoreductase